MSVSVYIAAPYPMRDEAAKLMLLLESYGVHVTSRWLKAPDEISDTFAREDLADIAAADVLVAMNPLDWGTTGSGGRHVEFGYALALGKPVVLWGVRSNIFHHLNYVRVVDDASEIINAITSIDIGTSDPEPLTFDLESNPDDRSEIVAKDERI